MTRRRFVRLAVSMPLLASAPAVALSSWAAERLPWHGFGGATPNDRFYVTSYGSTPKVAASAWQLRIEGLVRSPLVIGYQDLLRLPTVNEMLTLECISNPPGGSAIGNAQWVGTKLRPLIERAGIEPRAVAAVLEGGDGYATGVPVEDLLRPENFIAYTMNGVPLPPDHGFPARLMIPGKYGMKQPKWLSAIRFVDRPYVGYWEARGWSQSAWRKANAGFFVPAPPSGLVSRLLGTTRLKQPAELVGWALAGPAGVRKLEVSADGGKTWHAAELVYNASPYVWTVWRYRLAGQNPGTYTVRLRATTADGVVQPAYDDDTLNGNGGQASLTVALQ